MNYLNAENIYENSRKRKLANNTYLEKNDDGSYAIRLHKTQIIKFYPRKTVLNSGGWQTVTTKARINEFTCFNLWQKIGIWYLGNDYNINNSVVYADNIVYDHETQTWSNCGKNPKKVQQLRKRAIKYSRDFVKALFEGKVPAPSGGDCWGCCMRTETGETPMGNSPAHIIGHFNSNYFVPSLLVNAIDAYPISTFAKGVIGNLWQNNKKPEFMVDAAEREIISSN